MQKDALQNRNGVVKTLAEWEAEEMALSEVEMPVMAEEEAEEAESEEGEEKKEKKKRR